MGNALLLMGQIMDCREEGAIEMDTHTPSTHTLITFAIGTADLALSLM